MNFVDYCSIGIIPKTPSFAACIFYEKLVEGMDIFICLLTESIEKVAY